MESSLLVCPPFSSAGSPLIWSGGAGWRGRELACLPFWSAEGTVPALEPGSRKEVSMELDPQIVLGVSPMESGPAFAAAQWRKGRSRGRSLTA
jgi:hypothetical protein